MDYHAGVGSAAGGASGVLSGISASTLSGVTGIPYASPPVFASRVGQTEKGAHINIGGGPWLSARAA
ncbi:MAG TPA: hypothetical protein VKW06_11095 [Candidatus Angelobacter sp.]|nr:hypothetical protein [Candidatus Angelobacter sp.]